MSIFSQSLQESNYQKLKQFSKLSKIMYLTKTEQMQSIVILITFMIMINPVWEVFTDLKMIGRLFAFGSNWCLKYRVDADFYKQCSTITASDTEYCLYLRSRNNPAQAQPEYIKILFLPFLLNYFVCYYLWAKNMKPWNYCLLGGDVPDKFQISNVVDKVKLVFLLSKD